MPLSRTIQCFLYELGYRYRLMSSQAREALALKKGRLEEDVQELEKRVRVLLITLDSMQM